jgi:hypothetical protein
MPTYEAIQREVRIASGVVPKACWIADVLELLGKKLRVAPNRIDRRVSKYPCPIERQAAIIEALRKLGQHDLRPHWSSL